jgi:hypothetical protein
MTRHRARGVDGARPARGAVTPRAGGSIRVRCAPLRTGYASADVGFPKMVGWPRRGHPLPDMRAFAAGRTIRVASRDRPAVDAHSGGGGATDPSASLGTGSWHPTAGIMVSPRMRRSVLNDAMERCEQTRRGGTGRPGRHGGRPLPSLRLAQGRLGRPLRMERWARAGTRRVARFAIGAETSSATLPVPGVEFRSGVRR